MTPLSPADRAAADRVAALVEGTAPLAVAFSGGVDSSVLLALAARALGTGNVVAVLGVSPSLPAGERDRAHRVADGLGVAVVEVVTYEADREAYRANGPDRCFHCKDELFTRISGEVVARLGIRAVAYGENADDVLRPDRPGRRAAAAHRVLAPLADAGLRKADVRRLARALGLPCADTPATPCLASRIPHFTEVTAARLAQVDRAERALRALGFTELRVRHHGAAARVEVPVADLARALSPRVREAVRAAGFDTVTVDLAGLRSGAFTMEALRG